MDKMSKFGGKCPLQFSGDFSGRSKSINTPILAQFIIKKRGNQDLSREL
jgi:hypothetical protein